MFSICTLSMVTGPSAALARAEAASALNLARFWMTETVQRDGYRRLTVSFANLYDERVTAYLYEPDGLKPGERRPAVLALQSTGVEGKDIMDGRGPRGPSRAYGKEMAERGYVVIAPDYPSFGDQKNYDFAHSRYASGTMKAISDNMRCADLLLSRANVEPEKLAVIGFSLGGHNALFTAAFDTRLKAVVTTCGWTPFHSYYGGKKLANWAQPRYMPRVTSTYGDDPDRMPFDFAELIGAIAPRPVFSDSPLHDANARTAPRPGSPSRVRRLTTSGNLSRPG